MNEFKLFISGETARSRKIVADLESILSVVFGSGYTLWIIDVIKNPLLAQEDGIMATPTLMKADPPMKRIFGDFCDIEKVLERLGIHLSPDTMLVQRNEGGIQMKRNLS